MLNSGLYNEIVYKPQIQYATNTFIYEYDMSKANISSLRAQNIIDDATYYRLYNADRMTRQITVGNMIRNNKEIGKAKDRGIIEAKKMLFDANDIQDWEVLTIKNDAVFIIGRELLHTSFGEYYRFNCKNVYTIFLKLCDLEIYYYDRFLNNQLSIDIDVKGINDERLPLHEDGILGLICEICASIQRDDISQTLSYLTTVYDQYIQRQLPVEYYREFNNQSKYAFQSKYSLFYMDKIFPYFVPSLDINRNLLILRDLLNIVSNIYISDYRRSK